MVKEHRSLATTIIPAAVCLTLLMVFVAKRQPAIKHAASMHQTYSEAPAAVPLPGSGGSGSQPLPKTIQAADVINEVGRKLNVRAHELMKQRRFDEAIPILVRAVNEFGDNSKDAAYPYALFNLGQSLRMTGQPQKALRVLQKAQELDPANPLIQHEMDAARNLIAPKSASNQVHPQ